MYNILHMAPDRLLFKDSKHYIEIERPTYKGLLRLGMVLDEVVHNRLYRIEKVAPLTITEIPLFPGMDPVIGRRIEVVEVSHG